MTIYPTTLKLLTCQRKLQPKSCNNSKLYLHAMGYHERSFLTLDNSLLFAIIPSLQSHITSPIARSPRYPQSNGEAERTVRPVKALLKKADDPLLALLACRSTPLKNGYSPAELLMCRRLCTTVPVVPEQLQAKMPDYSLLGRRERNEDAAETQHTSWIPWHQEISSGFSRTKLKEQC